MPRGVTVFGANGSGKSTLGKELARVLEYKYMDIEEYHFMKSEIPYTMERSRKERSNHRNNQVMMLKTVLVKIKPSGYMYKNKECS